MAGRIQHHHGIVGLSILLMLLTASKTYAFSLIHTKQSSTPTTAYSDRCIQQLLFSRRSSTILMAKATKKKKKPKGGSGGGAAAGIKGFGAPSSGGGSAGGDSVATDRSKEARAFYEYLEQQGAGDNLKRCALGYFPLPTSLPTNDKEKAAPTLRGVVAMRDLKKGEPIISIPYEAAVNLGQEGGDPTLPALELLRDYCEVLGNGGDAANSKRKPYYEMLPPFRGDDCLGSTDFFSDDALEALQAPLVVEETLKRRERIKRRFQQDIAKDGSNAYPGFDDDEDIVASNDSDFPVWIDGTPVTEEHLRWAVWIITSRVLTVQGDAEEGKSYRLLIPFLDMCNHDRNSPHVLSGRAVPGGELKVVAGAAVKAGEQVNICYGGGVAGNDRFIQDYGFLDADTGAYKIVAQQLLGKRRLMEGSSAGKTIMETDREATLKKLRSTTMEEDVATLESSTDNAMRSAVEFRLAVKQALSKQIVIQ